MAALKTEPEQNEPSSSVLCGCGSGVCNRRSKSVVPLCCPAGSALETSGVNGADPEANRRDDNSGLD